MSVDALVLALASVIRPLSVSTVYAMLSTPRPTRLLTAYLVTGFVVSIGIGVVLATIPEFTWSCRSVSTSSSRDLSRLRFSLR